MDVRRFHAGTKGPRIISVGRFAPYGNQKRQDVLIEAFRMFHRLHPDWELCLAGATGGDPRNLQHVETLKVQAAGLPVRVVVDAPSRAIDDLLAGASIYWHAAGYGVDEVRSPDEVEHFGISIVEAMAAGAVPLVIQAGGGPEIIDPGRNGGLWNDLGELVGLTSSLIGDPALLARLAEGALARSRDFSPERFREGVSQLSGARDRRLAGTGGVTGPVRFANLYGLTPGDTGVTERVQTLYLSYFGLARAAAPDPGLALLTAAGPRRIRGRSADFRAVAALLVGARRDGRMVATARGRRDPLACDGVPQAAVPACDGLRHRRRRVGGGSARPPARLRRLPRAGPRRRGDGGAGQTAGGGRLLFDVRGFNPEEYVDAGVWAPDGAKFRIAKRVERDLFAAADGFVVLTEKARDILFPGCTGADPLGRPVEVIPCCVDLGRFGPPEADERRGIRRELGVEGRRVIVYVGSFGGFYLTEEMAKFLADAYHRDPSTFALMLSQSEPSKITGALERLGVPASAYLVRPVPPPDVPRHLKAADLAVSFIKPTFSKQASSPTKIAEYLACGLPVVCNAGVGDLDSLIEEDRVGVIIRELNSRGVSRGPRGGRPAGGGWRPVVALRFERPAPVRLGNRRGCQVSSFVLSPACPPPGRAHLLTASLMEPLDFATGTFFFALFLIVGSLFVQVTGARHGAPRLQIRLFASALAVRFAVSLALYAGNAVDLLGDDDSSGWYGGVILMEKWRQEGLTLFDIPAAMLGMLEGVNRGYPYLMALFFFLTKATYRLPVACVSGFCGAMTVVLTYRIAARVFSPQVAARAGWWSCFMPSLIIWSAQTLKEPIVIMLETVIALACVSVRLGDSKVKCLIVGSAAILLLAGLRFYAAYVGAMMVGFSLLVPRVRREARRP